MATSEPQALLLCDDLIFSSKITATARAQGLTVRVARSVDALLAMLPTPASAVILELDHSDFDVAALKAQLPMRVIAYGSHVNVERLKAARSAGCDLVMPRSQFVERLERDIKEWLRPV